MKQWPERQGERVVTLVVIAFAVAVLAWFLGWGPLTP